MGGISIHARGMPVALVLLIHVPVASAVISKTSSFENKARSMPPGMEAAALAIGTASAIASVAVLRYNKSSSFRSAGGQVNGSSGTGFRCPSGGGEFRGPAASTSQDGGAEGDVSDEVNSGASSNWDGSDVNGSDADEAGSDADDAASNGAAAGSTTAENKSQSKLWSKQQFPEGVTPMQANRPHRGLLHGGSKGGHTYAARGSFLYALRDTGAFP